MPILEYKRNGKTQNDLELHNNRSSASIDDNTTSTDKTWSSKKIDTHLNNIANQLGRNEDGTEIELPTTDKTIKGAIIELFQSASNGKLLIVNAITGKGITASVDDTFEQLAEKISQINGESTTEDVFTSFKFIHLSDTHYQYSQDATATVVSNINSLSDIDFTTITGDITVDQTQDDTVKETELAEYKTNFKDALDIPLYTCVGNHDLADNLTDIWKTNTGMDRLHELIHKDCVFLFADVFTIGWLDWIESKIAEYKGKRIFIYEHYEIENDEFTVGLKTGESRYTWNTTVMQRILKLLRNNRNIIWFTGHTHNAFKVAVNDVYNENGKMSTIVHTPYLCSLQGWEIEVNQDNTILKGISFSSEGISYLGDDYNYTIQQDTTDYGESEIIVENGTVLVGQNIEISVSLSSKPSSNQIVNISANELVSIDKTSLTFTPTNYNIPQKVQVTGVSEGEVRMVCSSNSKTSISKITISSETITNYFNKEKPLTPLGSYYGTTGSANYQLSNLIPAQTGDTVKVNTLGSLSSKMLKMFDADFNYIAENCNNVSTIDYTIAEKNVKYVAFVFRGATSGLADTIMCTVNQDMPSGYVSYNANPVNYTLTNYIDVNNPSQVDNYYNSSLVLTSKSGFNVSNLIPVQTGDTVYSNVNTSNYMYLFDESQTVIERVSINTTITNENAKYCALSYPNSATNLMIMKNQKVPGYYVESTDIM